VPTKPYDTDFEETCDNNTEDVVKNLFGQCSPEFGNGYKTPVFIQIHEGHCFSTPLKKRKD
jgi:hypothetical protein